EVPVESGHVNRRVIGRREPALVGLDDQGKQNAYSDDHVQRVQPGHRKIDGKEQLGVTLVGRRNTFQMEDRLTRNVVLFKLLVPLVGLHAEEDASEEKGEDQEPDNGFALSKLAGTYGHDHGETG